MTPSSHALPRRGTDVLPQRLENFVNKTRSCAHCFADFTARLTPQPNHRIVGSVESVPQRGSVWLELAIPCVMEPGYVSDTLEPRATALWY